MTSPSESQETPGKCFTRSHQFEKGRSRPGGAGASTSGDSSCVTTGHSSTRRGPVKHCASEPEVDSQSINAAISAAAAESVIPSAYYRARKKFAEIKSATQGDRRSSTASSYNRPGKVSPSKRTETEKSENRGSRGRQRRRRSLSLCESFSDGESTDGECDTLLLTLLLLLLLSIHFLSPLLHTDLVLSEQMIGKWHDKVTRVRVV